jgi:ribose/xylose/arabinose/galactoside ABC-type transport system permease subunit
MITIPKSLRRATPQLAAMIAMLVVDQLTSPTFFSIHLLNGRLVGSFVDVLTRGAPIALLALGMAGVIAIRGIDLSVGSIMAISGAIAANALVGGASWYHAAALALMAGLACGIWNGVLVAVLGLQPIVATLVLMVAGRGIAQLITDGQITTFNDAGFAAIATGSALGLPIPLLIVLVVGAVLAVLMRATALGIMVEAAGTNPRAAFLVGVNTRAVTIAVYAISGVTAAIAGLIVAADIQGADANNAGLWLELDAILIVVLGGGSLLGGSFSYALTLIGAITLQAIKTGILLAGFPPQANLVVMAALISVLLVLQAPATKRWIERRRFRSAAA